MGRWLRHRPGSAGLRSELLGITGAMGPSTSWDPWPRLVARAVVGCGGKGVYTDWLKWPLGAVLGHSCTLLHRCRQTWRQRSVHRLANSLLDHRRHDQLILPVGPEGQRLPHEGEPRGGRAACGRGPPLPPGQQVGRPVDVRPPCRAPSGTFAHSSPMSLRTPSLLAPRSIMPSIPGSPSVKRMPSPAYWSSAIVTSSATAGVPPGQTSSSLSR